jgi:hypothetical protein
MRKSRLTEEQIVYALKQVDAGPGHGNRAHQAERKEEERQEQAVCHGGQAEDLAAGPRAAP